jgi:hypothetical protein
LGLASEKQARVDGLLLSRIAMRADVTRVESHGMGHSWASSTDAQERDGDQLASGLALIPPLGLAAA